MALPDGRLSVHIRYAVTWFLQPSAFSVLIAASTAAAPLMSAFIIACDGSLGFKLMPPESYITPLPTMMRCGTDDFLPFALAVVFPFSAALPGR